MNGCQSPEPLSSPDLQGHRGCRGLFPENSIPAMRRALELGVHTLEMDVVFTRDRQLVLSHEPFFSHEICLDSTGLPIAAEREREYNIFQMDAVELDHFDCGSLGHPRFPGQARVRTCKPLLREVIRDAEAYAAAQNRPAPYYNIELKRQPQGDGIFHPDATESATLLIQLLESEGIKGRSTLQAFYPEVLEAARFLDKEIRLSMLEEYNPDFREVLDRLSFQPEIYSCHHQLVTPEMVEWCHARGMKVLPWTVNEVADMQRLLDLGVDGLISDYPDRFSELEYVD